MKKYAGMTLIELMLVLGIAGVITVLGIQQYSQYNRDNEVREIQSAVDKLFQGLAMYYQANCRASTDPPSAATLTISSLVTAGYLSNWDPIYTSIVDASGGSPNYGYSIQFNAITPSPNTTIRTPTSIYNNWLGSSGGSLTVSLPPATSTTVGSVYLWQSHVAVQLNSSIAPALYSMYKARLGATCSAASATATCSSTPAEGKFMIWESLPSSASPSTLSPSSFFMSTVKAFTNLYYNDDMYGTANPTIQESSQAAGNYYQCGG